MQNINQQTESVFDFEMQDFETVPQGQYIAIFKDVQKTNHEQWGDGVMFVFEIAAGEYKGQNATRIGKPQPTNKNATGKMISGITSRTFEQGQRIDLRQYIGMPYNVLMEPTQGGKTRIAQVWPYKSAQTAPVQPLPEFKVTEPQYQPVTTQVRGTHSDIDQIPF